jgi:solute carrier family 25 (mitochondrial iron transporter), member 28/37
MSKILNPQRKHDPFIHCISGGIAGAVAAAATNPLDVAKTLLQTRGTSLDPGIRNCSGLFDAMKLIYDRDGATGFMRGIRPRVIQMFPSTAICWTVYEFFKHFLYRNGGI